MAKYYEDLTMTDEEAKEHFEEFGKQPPPMPPMTTAPPTNHFGLPAPALELEPEMVGLTFSEKFGDLMTALAKAQMEMTEAKKTAENTFHHSKYAPLSEVMAIVRPTFARQGLALIQAPIGNRVVVEEVLNKEGGYDRVWRRHLTLVTRLALKEQWMESRFTVSSEKTGPQNVGSAITYMKRYAIQALSGIASEDDDGEAAEGRGTSKSQTQAAPQAAQSSKKTRACPSCGSVDSVFNEKGSSSSFYCWKKRDGCGYTWKVGSKPQNGGGAVVQMSDLKQGEHTSQNRTPPSPTPVPAPAPVECGHPAHPLGCDCPDDSA